MKTNPNDLEYPYFLISQMVAPQEGLTKREYFIGQALAGLCANTVLNTLEQKYELLAREAIMQTDALIDLLKDEK